MTVALTGRAIDVETLAADLGERREELLGFVLRRIKDRAAAEDLLQLAYARAIERMESLEDAGMVRAWFYRILRNMIVDFYRHRAVEARLLEPMETTFDVASKERETRNICGCMEQVVDGLKPEYAHVLREVELSEGEGATIDAYARREGITPGNAAVRAFRARKAMAKGMQHTCGSCAGAGCLDCSCSASAKL